MKMTKLRKNHLQYQLQESRGRLMESYPFFAILLMYLKFVAVDTIRNISTNGRCIFFNADFISRLNPSELDFLLCHQIMHIINGDIWRGHALAGDDYHRACDICNNHQLIALGWRVGGFSHLGKLQYTIPAYDGKLDDLSPREIYALLPYKLSLLGEKERKRYMTDTDYYWDYKNSEYVDGIVILDAPKLTKYVDELESQVQEKSEIGSGSDKETDDKKGIAGLEKENGETAVCGGEALEDFWSYQVEKAATTVVGMGKEAGILPGGIKRDIEKSKARVVDWKKMLDEFVQEEITDYSFTPPDRRYVDAGFFLPDYNERDYTPKDILFMADTSGSVSKEDLSRVYEEISSAIEQFGGKLNGKLGFFDVEVTEPIPFENVEDVRAIVPYGGGGTSFEIIFEYIREHLDEFTPAMIVIFTDGYAKFPERKAAMNIPVLWLISNTQITPPWGKVGRVI